MSKLVTRATIDDTIGVLYTKEQADAIVAGYPAHEREARGKGIPQLGSGRVFPIDVDTIKCAPFKIPAHFFQINGLDFGWDHPFGAVRCAYDADNDIFYVCAEYRQREQTPIVHAAAIKPWGAWIPCAWPADGEGHEKGSGKPLAPQYREQGLNMLESWATFEEGGDTSKVSVEAGVMDMLVRMQTGRFKVFETCGAYCDEVSYYHRVEGQIVKLVDDLISASRYALMMKRFAVQDPGPGHDLTRPMHANLGIA